MSPKDKIGESLKKALKELGKTEEPLVDPASNPDFGDYTTNIALRLKIDPEEIIKKIDKPESIDKIEAKDGFINFWLSKKYLQSQVLEIIKLNSKYGSSDLGKGKKARVEFVSANPTGPLHIGNARGGPLGDAIANVLEKVGYEVTREYLHNDVGGQVKKLGEAIYFALNPKETPKEEPSYKGEYIKELSEKVNPFGKLRARSSKSPEELGKAAVEIMFNEIMDDTKAMGIKFDKVYKESELKKEVPEALEKLKSVLKEKDGALWLAPSDEFLKDRETVVQKSDGEYTYFASDIAYHKEKFDSGADLVVDVLGSGHSGHVPRLQAAVKAMGFNVSKFKVILYQFVRLKEGETLSKMSKREGKFVTAREVLDKVGKDAFRFFLLTTSPETHMDFDMELAQKKANENPVFYIQYAYARISSIFSREAGSRSAGDKVGTEDLSSVDLSLLTEKEEIDLLRHLANFPGLVDKISQTLFVHQLTGYAHELANLYHRFYESQQVLTDNKDLSLARLALSKAVEVVLRENLTLLGIESPKKM